MAVGALSNKNSPCSRDLMIGQAEKIKLKFLREYRGWLWGNA